MLFLLLNYYFAQNKPNSYHNNNYKPNNPEHKCKNAHGYELEETKFLLFYYLLHVGVFVLEGIQLFVLTLFDLFYYWGVGL